MVRELVDFVLPARQNLGEPLLQLAVARDQLRHESDDVLVATFREQLAQHREHRAPHLRRGRRPDRLDHARRIRLLSLRRFARVLRRRHLPLYR
jgi:hypothetical protein